jgi:hypothetical protein
MDQSINMTIPFEISGNAQVDHIYVGNNRQGPSTNRPFYFLIGPDWTGRIGSLILCGLPGQNIPSWADRPFLGGARGHTVTVEDIDRIEKLEHYPDVSDWEQGGFPTADLAPTPWRVISRGTRPYTDPPVAVPIGYMLGITEYEFDWCEDCNQHPCTCDHDDVDD